MRNRIEAGFLVISTRLERALTTNRLPRGTSRLSAAIVAGYVGALMVAGGAIVVWRAYPRGVAVRTTPFGGCAARAESATIAPGKEPDYMDERTRLQHEAWSREFWGQLVYVSRSVTRRANEADVLGWHVRLVWGAGRGGIVYLHENRPEAFARGEMMRYVFTDFDAREEARHLVDEIVNHRLAVAA